MVGVVINLIYQNAPPAHMNFVVQLILILKVILLFDYITV